MKKSKKKYLLITSAVILATPALVQSVDLLKSEEVFAKTVSQEISSWSVGKVAGEEFSIDGITYHFISRNSDGTVKAIKKDAINNMVFDSDTNNLPSFNPSSKTNIGYYLNNTFYNSLPTYTKNQLVNNSWSVGHETTYNPLYDITRENSKKVTAYIGLLTRSEYKKSLEGTSTTGGKLPHARQYIQDSDFQYEWTATPYIEGPYTTNVFGVNNWNNSVDNVPDMTNGWSVRPAMVFKSNTKVDVEVPNQTPTNKTTIPAQTIANKGATTTVNLGNYFQDADGDNLTYTVSSNATSRVTGSVSGSTLTLSGVAKGSASITVTAKDPSGASVSQTFTTTVGNAAPTNKGTIPAQEMSTIGEQISLNLGNYFQDVDGDNLTYTVSSSATDKVTGLVNGSTLNLTSVSVGTSTITVTALDGAGGIVSQTFTTTVKAPTPVNKNTIATQFLSGAGQSKQLTLSDYFEDASGPLTYTVTSSATNKVGVSVTGDKLTLNGLSKGDSLITVTAKNSLGQVVSQTFTTTVSNTSPTLTTNFDKLNLRPGDVSSVIVLTGIDPDGDNLSYVVSSSNDNVAKVKVTENQLIVEGLIEGSANIMVKVIDGDLDYGHTVSTKTFTVDVAQPAPIAPSEPIDVDNTGGLTNGSVNLGDIFDDENPGDLIFKPNVLVNEPEADIFIENQMLMIENPKNDGLISVEVEATNIFGKTAVATLNMLIEVDNSNKTETKDGKATLKLLQGEFTLNTSDSESFGKVKLTAAKQTVTTGFAGDFGTIDARGTQEGWNVTVSATPFTVESFDGFVGEPHQLPMGSLALNNVTGIERVNHTNKVDGLPTALINGLSVIDINNSLSILNANQGEGLGEFKFNFGEDALALTVDARTAKIDTVNYPDKNTPYASTVTWDLISGPQM